MSGPSSPKATPKRKRDDFISQHRLPGISPSKILATPTFTFEPPSSSQTSTEDGSNSPRTQTANKFRNLSLDRGGGGVPPSSSSTPSNAITNQEPVVLGDSNHSPEPVVFDFVGDAYGRVESDSMQLDADDDDAALRKRHKHQELGDEIAPGVNGESTAEAVGPIHTEETGRPTMSTAVDPTIIKVARSAFSGGLKKSYPSINRLADSKSRGRARSGTSPVSFSRRKSSEAVEEEPIIVDPVRAALTWHEDEITVYDSEDPNDDGTGLNGIGFRPTPAMAYQRAQQRKRQLSEYKKREESEARALRNQKRREALAGGSELEGGHSAIRVRFSDMELETLVTI